MAGCVVKDILFLIYAAKLVFCKDVTVQTSLGDVTGVTEEVTFGGSTFVITKFLGIPFAKPPVGSLRFRRPVENGPFVDAFIAKTMQAECIQNVHQLNALGIDPKTRHIDEDCLYLNIYTPGDGEISTSMKRAVMIWIHGGAFSIGSQNEYDAKAFVGLNDVILVTLNYRLSLLGFLSSADGDLPGNNGLWDQYMGIKWVNKHIHNFGGDPQRVTIFGQSAGSASVIYQAMYEKSEGLFQRIIAQSGSANSPWAYDLNPTERYTRFANKSGCLGKQITKTKKVIKCLRDLSISEIKELVGISDEFLPVRDGEIVKMHPIDVFLNATDEADVILKRLKKHDMIIGVNSAEGGALIPLLDFVMGNTQSIAGYSMDAFENIIVPFALEKGKLNGSMTLVEAIQHQYIDWSDPENTTKIFHTTVDLLSDVLFNDPVTKTALAVSDTKGSGSLFFYVFDHSSLLSDDRLRGAMHIEEVRFVFGFPSSFGLGGQANIPQEEIELSEKMMKYWTNFAKTGNPNSQDLTILPQYDSETQKYIRFQANKADFTVETRYVAERIHFWHKLVPVLRQQCNKICPECKDNKRDTVYGCG